MNPDTKKKITAGALIALFIGTAVALGFLGGKGTTDSQSVSNADDAAVRTFVQNFAQTFKNVSLLADDVNAQIDREYTGYVSPELLTAWKERRESAPGRYTSSPWPESMEVVEVVQTGNTFRVKGNVLEVTTGEGGKPEPAAVYPLTLAVEKRGDSYMISKLTKGAYSELPHRQTVIGFWECLPRRDTTGPQTMECAFGIALAQGDGRYAVNTSLMSTYPVDFPTGTKVKISGIVTPANQLSSDQWQKYDIDGIISATTIEKL